MIRLRDYQQKVMDAIGEMKSPILLSYPCRSGMSYISLYKECAHIDIFKGLPSSYIASGKNLFSDFSGAPYTSRYWGIHAWSFWDRIRSAPLRKTKIQSIYLHMLYPFHWSRYAE